MILYMTEQVLFFNVFSKNDLFVFIFQWNRLLIETLSLFCLVEYQLVRVASLSNACPELLV